MNYIARIIKESKKLKNRKVGDTVMIYVTPGTGKVLVYAVGSKLNRQPRLCESYKTIEVAREFLTCTRKTDLNVHEKWNEALYAQWT